MTETPTTASLEAAGPRSGQKFLFAACFVALMATSFAFIIRIMVMGHWKEQFGLDPTQMGEIFGAGFWPFGISIVLFSLIIDRIGYGKSMIFAFACHVASTVLLITAEGYWGLYVGSCLNGLAAGTIEAVINPAVASMFPRSKTKMLTTLHAGWPGGMVVGGLAVMLLGGLKFSWQVQVGVILIPVAIYGLMLMKARFPVHERVAAGIPYRDMLKEAGALGCLIVLYIIIMEVNRVLLQITHNASALDYLLKTSFFNLPCLGLTIVLGVLTLVYLVYAGSLGRWMYIFLLLIMIVLATTELGVDSWVTGLMESQMGKVGLPAVFVLLYMQTIMAILRLCIGPIVKVLKPLGVLLCAAVVAAVGLWALSGAEGLVLIAVAATIYGVGKTYFWPVTLGVVSERFPKGGALTINAIGGVGMLGVGILGAPLLGFWQNTRIDQRIKVESRALYALVMKDEVRKSTVGEYRPLDEAKAAALLKELKAQAAVGEYVNAHAKSATAPAAEAAKAFAADKDFRKLVADLVECLLPPKPAAKADPKQLAEYEAQRKDLATFEAQLAWLEARGKLSVGKVLEPVQRDRDLLAHVGEEAQKSALSRVAILPAIMAVCYLLLVLYFKATGGYKPVELAGGNSGGH